MAAPRKYPDELRDRSQRLVAEAMTEDSLLSLNAAVKRVGQRVGVNPDTLRGWVKQHHIDADVRPGTMSSDSTRIKQLEGQVRELKRANEILLAARRRSRTSDRYSRPRTGHAWTNIGHIARWIHLGSGRRTSRPPTWPTTGTAQSYACGPAVTKSPCPTGAPQIKPGMSRLVRPWRSPVRSCSTGLGNTSILPVRALRPSNPRCPTTGIRSGMGRLDRSRRGTGR